VRAAEEAVELVEAPAQRMKFLVRAKVPLADHAGAVAGGLELLRQRRLGQWQAKLFLRHLARIELMAEASLVTARQQPRARRAAIWPADVAAGETHAVLGERIQMRRGDVLAAVRAHVAPAVVVGDDEQDVGLLGSKRRKAKAEGEG
jgi:hypothetical protein